MTELLSPPVAIFFDDPKLVKHYTGKSVRTLRRWAREGLTIRSKTFESGATRQYVLTTEYIAFLKINSATNQESAE